MKKHLIWNTRPFYPPVKKNYLALYTVPAIRTKVKIKAWFGRVSGLFGDDFKSWVRDLIPILVFLVVVAVPFLPKPVFWLIFNIVLGFVAACFFLAIFGMPLICIGVFIYFFFASIRELSETGFIRRE